MTSMRAFTVADAVRMIATGQLLPLLASAIVVLVAIIAWLPLTTWLGQGL